MWLMSFLSSSFHLFITLINFLEQKLNIIVFKKKTQSCCCIVVYLGIFIYIICSSSFVGWREDGGAFVNKMSAYQTIIYCTVLK